ncbi:MAG: hypothetical protein DWQ02_16665 [Bacteroidetes bacterium]|nr:MAG: hypothetical protein DWQ02_16665 [Bacteroidota bacterium]
MKIQLALILGLSFTLISCISNKEFDQRIPYLKESERVLYAFHKTFGDTLYESVPRIDYGKIIKGGRYIQISHIPVNTKEQIQKLVRIRPYSKLASFDKSLLEKLAQKTGEASNGVDLYYKIINYWILSHYLCHKMTIPEMYDTSDTWQQEIILEKYNLYFLIKSGYSRKFQDFEKFVQLVYEETKLKVGEFKDQSEITKDGLRSGDFTHFMFFKSSSMLEAYKKAAKE